MDLLQACREATRMLWHNRLYSGLTVLGIVIGNAATIASIGVGQGLQRLAAEELEGFGPNMLYVVPDNRNVLRTQAGTPKTLILADAAAIAAQVPSVDAVAPQIRERKPITSGSRTINAQLVGTTPEFLDVRNFQVERGRFFSTDDVTRSEAAIVLGPGLAERLFGLADPIGRQVRIEGLSLQVVGVMSPKGSLAESNQDEAAFLPISTMAKRLIGQTSPFGTEVTVIAFSAEDASQVNAAEFQVRNLLRLRHQVKDVDDFVIHSQQQFLQTSDTIGTAIVLTLAAVAGISLLVAGIGIMNAMLMSVKARTVEIGLRKAVGARERDIMLQFLVEALVLATIGGTIGAGLGASSMMVLSVATPLNARVSAIAITVALGVSGSIGLGFGVLPARRAARLDPIVALRSA